MTVPVTEVPSVVKFNGFGADVEATPDNASEAENGKATLVLFQPAALGAGLTDDVIVGTS